MRLSFLILPLLSVSIASCATTPRVSSSGDPKLTVRRIFDDPSLEGNSPRALRFSPDGSRITYLKGKPTDSQVLDLWEFDLKTGTHRLLVDSATLTGGRPENLSAEEKARRERMRIKDSGIVEYSWSKSGNALVFPIGGALYLYSLEGNGSSKKLTSGRFHETDAHLSPKGDWVSFVRRSNLYRIDTRSGKERRITSDGGEAVKYGIAEFVAQEEMDRFDGQWWSDDGRALAFTRTDESPVEIAKRYEIDGDGLTVTEQRYPRTGTKNALVKLAVLDLRTRKIRWLDLGPNADIYLARVNWLPDNRTLAVQVESRDQKGLDLIFFDTRTGKKTPILTEENKHWVELNDDLRFLKNSDRFIWASERTGARELYLYNEKGDLIRQLTHQKFSIHAMAEVDGGEKFAYFTASGSSPLEQHLFRVSLDTGAEEQITREEGWHGIEMAKRAAYYIDRYSNSLQPPQVSVHSADGHLLTYIEENRIGPGHPLADFLPGFSKPEYGSFISSEGTELYYRLIKPRGYQSGHRYPVIVSVYGGPDHQVVQKAWGGKWELWNQSMASQGFVVFSVDNRGSSGRDRAFEDAVYHHLGNAEVEDQKAGVDFLIQQGIADPSRIGVFGWSYGGYMTLMCMLKHPELFKVGVSVAPVTDWSLYDTFYTERFLGTPAQNPAGYEDSDVMKYIDHLSGKLLMIHGMADDNVLFTNSTRIYKALQDRGIPFDMMAYPGSKHGIYGKMRQIHVFEKISAYFQRNL